MSGLVSTYARTRAVIKLTGGEGGDSWGLLGFDGKRPRLPLRLSVRTTVAMNDQIVLTHEAPTIICSRRQFQILLFV